MPTIAADKPCPNCHNTGVAKFKCEKCGTVWCSKCKDGVAGKERLLSVVQERSQDAELVMTSCGAGDEQENEGRIFTGTAGVYYVMYQLAARAFTPLDDGGNAPYLDILVSSEEEELAAWRFRSRRQNTPCGQRGRGDQRKVHHLEFPLGWKAAKLNRAGVMFAFVDLAVWSTKQAVVYLVPSPKVCELRVVGR